MPILTILLVLIVVGFLLWLVNTKVPLEPTIKLIINILVIVVLIIWILKVTGVWGSLGSVRV
jgi:hypothetical protein